MGLYKETRQQRKQTRQPMTTQYKGSQGLFEREGRGTLVRTMSRTDNETQVLKSRVGKKKAGKWRQEVEH